MWGDFMCMHNEQMFKERCSKDPPLDWYGLKKAPRPWLRVPGEQIPVTDCIQAPERLPSPFSSQHCQCWFAPVQWPRLLFVNWFPGAHRHCRSLRLITLFDYCNTIIHFFAVYVVFICVHVIFCSNCIYRAQAALSKRRVQRERKWRNLCCFG